MFQDRISDAFPQFPAPPQNPCAAPPTTPQHFLPMASLEAIYHSAAARAKSDHALDRLFNPDYYEDRGSGN